MHSMYLDLRHLHLLAYLNSCRANTWTQIAMQTLGLIGLTSEFEILSRALAYRTNLLSSLLGPTCVRAIKQEHIFGDHNHPFGTTIGGGAHCKCFIVVAILRCGW